MYHSISFFEPDDDLTQVSDWTFGETEAPGVNTWVNWHLIPSSRPVVNPPGVTTSFVDLPGRDGALDLTDYLTGGPVLGQRQGSWEFYVYNEHPSSTWDNIRYNIMTYLHGKRKKCVLESSGNLNSKGQIKPSRFWIGRFTVNEWKSESYHSTVTIDYVIEPWNISIKNPEGNLHL